MKVPISWFNEYVDIDMPAKEFGELMTMSGSKVEVVESLGDEIKNVVVGKILEIEKHPDAEKLVVTKVDVGSEIVQIVTGANNISVNDYVPIALHGAKLPGGVKIKKSKLRGIPSNGMMCSIEELGLTREDYPDAAEHGIYILKDEPKLGTDIREILNLNDATIEFEITSNRPDCFGVIGLSREAAVTVKKPIKLHKPVVKEEAGENVNDYISIDIKADDLCKRYAARVVKNVKIEPSPEWMQDRLKKSGVRPINNIVDITNYVMLEYCQPMHAFDYDKIAGHKIIVRRAEDGEELKTLDGVERKLDNSILVIADEKQALVAAGVMGGEDSEITQDTTTLLLEAANFAGTEVRLAAKKLGIRTESSSRFEKGLDVHTVEEALDRAAELIEQLNAGQVVKGKADVFKNKPEPRVIDFEVEKINALLGFELSKEYMAGILTDLEFKVDCDNMKLQVPSFRPDVERCADVAEEIARFYGYDKIESNFKLDLGTQGVKTYEQKLEDKTKEILLASGLDEIITYAFIGEKDYDNVNMPKDHKDRKSVEIINPLGQDQKYMRTTMLPSMMNTLALNNSRKNKAVGLFELAKVYIPVDGQDLPNEIKMISIGTYGKGDFFALKGVLEELFEKLNVKVEYAPKQTYSFHPYRSAEITCGGKWIGIIGEVHPEVTDNYGINEKVYYAMVDFDMLVEKSNMDKKYVSLPKFPAVERDIAITIKEEALNSEIEKIIAKNSKGLIETVELFDVYQGKQIQAGFKSMAYGIMFRAKDRTLTDEDVNPIMESIVAELEEKLDAKLR